MRAHGEKHPPRLAQTCRSLLLQEHIRLDAGLLEDGAQRALGHVAGVVGDGGVAVGGRVVPDLMAAGGLTMGGPSFSVQ